MAWKNYKTGFDSRYEKTEEGTYAPFELVKAIILEKRHKLMEEFSNYLKVTKLRKYNIYVVGWVKWINSINSLYLEVRSKINRPGYKEIYKDSISILEASILKDKDLTYDEARKATLHLIDFCETLGITDIIMDRPNKGSAILNS